MCGYQNCWKRSLTFHQQVVHEDKKFQCQDCGKGFSIKRKLEYHRISIHLKTKPFNCRYGCEISYSDPGNRNAHERKTHGKLFITVKEQRLKERAENIKAQ